MRSPPRFPSPCAALLCALAFAACTGAESAGDFQEEPDPDDLVPVADDGKADGVSATFDKNRVVDDDLFVDSDALDADEVQAFFEHTPYGKRSWLADERLDGRPASAVIVDTAHAVGINPLLILVRLQVERSLVSKSVRPSANTVAYALGCGCPDSAAGCGAIYYGLERQLVCSARTMRRWYDSSADGSGWWRAGHPRKSADGVTVTPANHATASLYAYTPWVLPNTGGNWLAWNVTRRFAIALEQQGAVPRSPWVGQPCADDGACAFSSLGEDGACWMWGADGDESAAPYGFCTLDCEGYCPDRSGYAGTFCVSLLPGAGTCVAKAASENGQCSGIPGTIAKAMPRWVGQSGTPAATATVCVPR